MLHAPSARTSSGIQDIRGAFHQNESGGAFEVAKKRYKLVDIQVEGTSAGFHALSFHALQVSSKQRTSSRNDCKRKAGQPPVQTGEQPLVRLQKVFGDLFRLVHELQHAFSYSTQLQTFSRILNTCRASLRCESFYALKDGSAE